MLTTLTVENFALIENVAIEFGAGLNILTGETGAGKSILIDALGAVLGNRCGVNRIRKGADKLSIAATFSEGLRLRRTVSRTGKGSITLNDKPITLAQLKKVCAELVDVHGQNKSLELLREDNIYRLIDDEEISAELKEYQRLYRALSSKTRELADKKSAQADNLRRLEFLRWQEQEISAARLKPNEDEELAAQIKKLSHAEKIAEHVQQSAMILNDGDSDVLTALARVEKNLDDVTRYDDKLNSARKLLEDARINLREAYEEIRDYGSSLDFAPELLDELHEREDVLFNLKRKYGATVNEIITRLDSIRADIAAAENFDSDVEELERNIAELNRQTKSHAEKLLQLRRAAAKVLSTAIEAEIRRLGMEHAQFEIVIESADKFSLNGGDTADILFCANVGEEKLSLSKVVSGGELSRIALAIKAVTAERDDSATMVFDEIDAGLGGVTAKTVAEAIAKVARGRQVLCVTHLAQIAGMADIHLQITKSELNGRTITKVQRLDYEGRVKEIARMASGGESTISIDNAREMISSANRFKEFGEA